NGVRGALVGLVHDGRPVVGVENDEQDVLVEEVVVAAAEPLVPGLRQGRRDDVVVAGNVEEGHLELLDVAPELAPLLDPRWGRVGAALDQVADAHYELGLEQVELLDGPAEDAGAVSAGPVADDGELELVLVAVEAQVSPRVEPLGLHAKS